MISAEGPTAVAFDAHGRLLVASYTGAHWYDAALQPVGDGPPAARQATALVFDRNDNLIVVMNGSTRRLAPDGTLLGSVATGGTDADLAADNCTLYLGGPQIGRMNVCTMTALAPIPRDAYGVRVLSDGSLLTVGGGYVRRLRNDGTLIAEQQIPVRSTSVTLSADGSFAWLDGARRRYDFATNAASPYDESLGTGQAVSAAVYGGWTAARGAATYASPGGDASPDVSVTSVPVLGPLLLSALALALAAVAVRART
jgi:hypothetical protein